MTSRNGPRVSIARMFPRLSPIVLRSAMLTVAVAMAASTVGADLVDLVTCGVEDAADCRSLPEPDGEDEGTCDHCPSCAVSHGHMQLLLSETSVSAPTTRGAGLASLGRHLRLRVSAQDIFHPPIALSV